MKVPNPTSGFQAWGTDQRTGNSQGILWWGPVGFDYRPSRGQRETETPVLEGTNKILCAPRPRGENQWPHRRENYLLGLKGSCGSMGQQGLTTRTGALEGPPWHKPSWSLPLTLPQSCRSQGWVASGQTTTREGVQPHPSADNWIEALLI